MNNGMFGRACGGSSIKSIGNSHSSKVMSVMAYTECKIGGVVRELVRPRKDVICMRTAVRLCGRIATLK